MYIIYLYIKFYFLYLLNYFLSLEQFKICSIGKAYKQANRIVQLQHRVSILTKI